MFANIFTQSCLQVVHLYFLVLYSNQVFASGLKIIGGKEASEGQFPYQLSLRIDGRHHCGAALIKAPDSGHQIVITAAHCLHDRKNDWKPFSVESISVSGGSVYSNSRNEQVISVKNVTWPDEFDPRDFRRNDIALITLQRNFRAIPRGVKMIELYQSDYVFEKVTLSGWGLSPGNATGTSWRLKYVKLPIIDLANCKKNWGEESGEPILNDAHICAGDLSQLKSGCKGDAGGPAVISDGRNKYLVGIFSLGIKGCKHYGIPNVFTRVSYFEDWIRERTNNLSFWNDEYM